MIPENLYGRDREIAILLGAFDGIVGGGRPRLVLVSGYSGVGKSAVVNELHKALVPPRGLFASGKFDQYKRDIPYATLAQAFQELVRPLLGKREDELRRWRDALRAALEPNGLLIVDLVPELKHVIGEQPAVLELSPAEAQRRFHLVLRRFIGVFARPEHPLAVFLDDLQWLDAATLDFLEDLLTQTDVGYLLLVGAYRDNEVHATHPLVRKLDAVRRSGGAVQDIVLSPLRRDDLGQMLADALHCEPERAGPLAALIHDKTAGNPFFVIQFILALEDQGLLVFDHGEGRWRWDLPRIHARGFTDNVVELMIDKLGRLPAVTQKALQQFACMGNSATFDALRMVYPGSADALHEDLWDAVRAGLIFRGDDAYRFLHDRVHEAERGLAFAAKARLGLAHGICGSQLALVRCLRGSTAKFGHLEHDGYSEADTELDLASDRNLRLVEFFYWVRKLQARVLAGQASSAVDAAVAAQRLLWSAAANFETEVSAKTCSTGSTSFRSRCRRSETGRKTS